jgi:hypothetical protein
MNAEKEFLECVEGKTVLCAEITKGGYRDASTHTLRIGYDDTDYSNFLQMLNFEYDDGFGGQELFGMIWFTDGTWAERGEYDGSEWWAVRECPNIPRNLKRG